MSHVKSTLESSAFFKKLTQRAKSQNNVKKQVLEQLSPLLRQEVLHVYIKKDKYYITVKSNQAIIAIRHSLANLGHPFQVLYKVKDLSRQAESSDSL